MAKRRIIFLALFGLVAGVGIGLFLGWQVWPVEYYDTDLTTLHPDYKFEYAVMVGTAYEQDGDLERAEMRLRALGLPDTATWLRDLIHQSIAGGRDPSHIRYLVSLAKPMGIMTSIMEPFAED